MVYCLLFIILYLKVSLQSIFYETICCGDFQFLLDSATLFPPLTANDFQYFVSSVKIRKTFTPYNPITWAIFGMLMINAD